jgi:hypothetical protein
LDDFEDRLTLYKNIENILDWIKKSQAKQQTA